MCRNTAGLWFRILLTSQIMATSSPCTSTRPLTSVWTQSPRSVPPKLKKMNGSCREIAQSYFFWTSVQHLRFDHEILIDSLRHYGGYLAQHRAVSGPIFLMDLCLLDNSPLRGTRLLKRPTELKSRSRPFVRPHGTAPTWKCLWMMLYISQLVHRKNNASCYNSDTESILYYPLLDLLMEVKV